MPTYFLTWTTYGTWLHGDPRGSVSREQNRPGTTFVAPSRAMVEQDAKRLKHVPIVLNEVQRRCVDSTIRAHAEYRRWQLHAVNVRTNHVHVVCTGALSPERMMGEFKSWATRSLRQRQELGQNQRVWTTHGSTRWLDSEMSIASTVHYVTHRQ